MSNEISFGIFNDIVEFVSATLCFGFYVFFFYYYSSVALLLLSFALREYFLM